MRTLALVMAVVAGAGCVTARSVSLGQLASAAGRGAADINVFAGGLYQAQTAPPTTTKDVLGDPVSNQVNSTGLSIPWFEANATYGLTDRLGLNVHLSPAGIQPGLKITLNKSRIANLALLPQLGIGYASYGDSTTTSGVSGAGTVVNPTFTSSLIFSAGLKVLISHRSGFYCGLGYDLIVTRNFQMSTLGNPQTAVTTQTTLFSIQHQLAAAIGISIKVGMISIRPELGFAIAPSISGTQTIGTTSYSAGGGWGWAILPGFGFAITSPPDRSDKGAEEDDRNVGEAEERPAETTEDPPEKEERDLKEDN